MVHDWTMEGIACAAKLQVAENLHTQFALGFWGLPFSEQHYIEGHSVDSLLCPPLMDCQHWLALVALDHQINHQQCHSGIQGKLLSIPFSTPLPQHLLRVELHLGFGLFLCSAERDEILLTITVRVAPDMMTLSSLRFGTLEKLAMTFRLAMNCLSNL